MDPSPDGDGKYPDYTGDSPLAEPTFRIQTRFNQRIRQRTVNRVGNQTGNYGGNTQMRDENGVSTHTAEEQVEPVDMVFMQMGDEQGIDSGKPFDHGLHGMCQCWLVLGPAVVDIMETGNLRLPGALDGAHMKTPLPDRILNPGYFDQCRSSQSDFCGRRLTEPAEQREERLLTIASRTPPIGCVAACDAR